MTETTRLAYREELAELEATVLSMVDLVTAAMRKAVEAVMKGDDQLAAIVVAEDETVDGRYLSAHNGILSLLARQAPVAVDLRLVAALLQMSILLERSGDLCVNIAKLVPLSDQGGPSDRRILDWISEMAAQDAAQMEQAKLSFEKRDVAMAEELAKQDDRIDRLNRQIFKRALEVGGEDPGAREWASYMMFVARYLERFGDHTVDIGEQAAFVVTGLFREFTDASRPDSLAISGGK